MIAVCCLMFWMGAVWRTTGRVNSWTVLGRVMGSHWKSKARYIVAVMPKKVAASVARVMADE